MLSHYTCTTNAAVFSPLWSLQSDQIRISDPQKAKPINFYCNFMLRVKIYVHIKQKAVHPSQYLRMSLRHAHSMHFENTPQLELTVTDIPPDVLLVTENGDVSITSLPELMVACCWCMGWLSESKVRSSTSPLCHRPFL